MIAIYRHISALDSRGLKHMQTFLRLKLATFLNLISERRRLAFEATIRLCLHLSDVRKVGVVLRHVCGVCTGARGGFEEKHFG